MAHDAREREQLDRGFKRERGKEINHSLARLPVMQTVFYCCAIDL
jgi:hypothetical protein